MIYFVYDVIQTSCFFFPEKVNNLYEQSSLCVWPAVGAYQNPWLLLPGLDIVTVSVTFGTKFSPFTTKTPSAVKTLRPVFTQINKEIKNLTILCPNCCADLNMEGKILLKFQTTQCYMISSTTRFCYKQVGTLCMRTDFYNTKTEHHFLT